MKFRMTVIRDVRRSAGRQITVELTSDNPAIRGKIRQMGEPYQITKTFGRRINRDTIITIMKQEARNELNNFIVTHNSLVNTTVEVGL